MKVLAWFIARPALAGALLLTLALAGWHWQDRISDWFDGRKIARLEQAVAAQAVQIAALERSAQLQEAAIKAAQAARNRNDTQIPRVRRETAAAADRAATADGVQRVRDVADALGAYGAAADQL